MSNGVPVIEVAGEVNASAEHRLQEAYDAATSNGESTVLLDFGPAEYINSTGIALIVGLLAQARAGGVEVQATGLSAHYREIFEITRLADFMTIVPDGQSDGR